jgi:hypothetical protein
MGHLTLHWSKPLHCQLEPEFTLEHARYQPFLLAVTDGVTPAALFSVLEATVVQGPHELRIGVDAELVHL